MSKKTLAALCGFALFSTLAACDGGKARNDTLVDGAVDRPTGGDSRSAAKDVGPATAAGTGAANNPAQGGAPAATGPTLAVATQGAHAGYLTDASGAAVYHLEGDRDGRACTGDCLMAWPPVLVTGAQPSGATGLQGAMIATVARPEGTTQVTYNGLPLYRYAADAGVGSTNGHGVKDKYGTWHLVTAQGAPMAAGHTGH